MYGINKDTQVNESKYFDAGIHDEVTLEKVCYENSKKDGTGKNVLAFHFKGKNGETFRHVEFPVDADDPKADSKFKNLGVRIKHILLRFVPEDQIIIANVNSFEEYCNAVIALIGNKNKETKVAIKLVYDDRGNLGFTKYVGFIANTPSGLKIGTSEKLTKVTSSPESSTSVEEAF